MEQTAWAVDICPQMRIIRSSSSLINQEQCSVLNSLAESIEECVQLWTAKFGEEINSATEAWKELLRVLKNGLLLVQLCANEDDEEDPPNVEESAQRGSSHDIIYTLLGFKGECNEIIDDARMYTQMINCLIEHAVFSQSPADSVKLKCIRELREKIDSECQRFKHTLEQASQQDIEKLLISKAEVIFDRCCLCLPELSLRDFLISRLEPLLTTELLLNKPNIDHTDLQIGDYLGDGGFGKVKHAQWLKLDVAIKYFDKDKYLQKELRIFDRLLKAASPHVVQILGHTTERALVLELMEKDLTKIIEGRALPLIPALEVMLQISKAMRHLHSLNLIYRDLKPQNVLVKTRKDGSLICKISNFQACLPTDNSDTWLYRAPEMRDNDHGKKCSRKVDVYSFGLLCCEILSGQKPPEGRDIKTIEAFLDKLPPELPMELGTLIYSCLNDVDKERPTFEDICDMLWLVKENVLVEKVSMPICSTPTGKRAIYNFPLSKSRASSVKNIPIDMLSDIRLENFYINASGAVQGRLSDRLFKSSYWEFKKLKDRGKRFNLYLEIGGWDFSTHFSSTFSNEKSRTEFVTCIHRLLTIEYPAFNGLVLDWMYISDNGKNYGKPGNTRNRDDVDNLVLVLRELRGKLPEGSFIIALACAPNADSQWPIEKAVSFVDQVHLCTHNFHSGEWERKTAHQSNLYSSSYGAHSVDLAVKLCLKHGVPSSKIFIGGTMFAVGFSSTEGLGRSGAGKSPHDWFPYNKMPVAGAEEWDDEAKAGYAYDPVGKVFDSYDNVRSMVEKAEYVKRNGLGGIVIWEGWNDFPPENERSIMRTLHTNLTHTM